MTLVICTLKNTQPPLPPTPPSPSLQQKLTLTNEAVDFDIYSVSDPLNCTHYAYDNVSPMSELLLSPLHKHTLCDSNIVQYTL